MVPSGIKIGTEQLNIQGDRREPDVFEMVSMKLLAEVGRGCRY